jgi:hypothetical protein
VPPNSATRSREIRPSAAVANRYLFFFFAVAFRLRAFGSGSGPWMRGFFIGLFGIGGRFGT